MAGESSNWANSVEQEEADLDARATAGFESVNEDAPPGFEHVAPGTHSVGGISDGLANVQMNQQHGSSSRRLVESEAEPTTVLSDDSVYTSAERFEDLDLPTDLLKGLYLEMHFERPSRIQALTLPMILDKRHQGMIAQAHNGSGKTTCFVLAMLSRVDPTKPQPQALCICPTRELVIQNLQVLRQMAKYTGITSTSTASDGGESGVRRSKVTEQVVIGTHGTLHTWVGRRQLPLEDLQILVFDEADEMLKGQGFASDSTRVINQIRKEAPQIQILLFSATFDEQVKRFAEKTVPNANRVFIPKEDLSLDVIKQYKVVCPSKAEKTGVLKEMIFPVCEKLGQTIIFVRTRDTASKLHTELEADGHKCTSIQGGMEHSARDRVIEEFRSGTTKILISTDVLARGFDVTQVTLVVNYDVPVERDQRRAAFETYLHRIGRSGRFGRKGAAFNLISGDQEAGLLQSISDYFQRPIPDVKYDDEEQFLKVLKDAGLTDG